MTDSASGTPGTGDEQRTTALPRPGRPAEPGRPAQPGQRPAAGAWPAAPEAHGPAGWPATPPGSAVPPAPRQQLPADANPTTVLPRAQSWPSPAPTPSNLPGASRPWPGAVRPAAPAPHWRDDPAPSGFSDPRGAPERGREPAYREPRSGDPYRRRRSGDDDDRAPREYPPDDRGSAYEPRPRPRRDPYQEPDRDSRCDSARDDPDRYYPAEYHDGPDRYPDYDDGSDRRGAADVRRGASGRSPDAGRTGHLPPYHEHLPPYQEPLGLPPADTAAAGTSTGTPAPVPPGTGGRAPRKLTVTRVAALRSRELTHRGIEKFHGAVSADGADRSGLTHLTYAVMANYAVDAALAVALANTLFFAAAKADSTGKVLLYLLLTVAPFAVIAPLIGPLLDRIQSGRRIALAVSSFGRALLALVMALKFDSWVIYPCALGMLVLSKSFGVLKAALTPRVLPEEITLVKTNSRLSVFGLIAGGVAGAVAAGFSWLINSPGALFFTAACAVVCGVLCLRIPAWVESTEGEVPVRKRDRGPRQRVFPQAVAATLWTNATIRIETGFLALFIAFVVKSMYQSSSVVAPADGSLPAPTHPHTGFMQLALLGAVGAAAGIGGFVGNALGARLTLRNPERVAVISLGAIILSVVVAILLPGLVTAGLVAFVGSTGSSLAKVCLDSVIQRDLPEVTRASAFGRSESVLQLSWVFGGVIGLLVGGVWALSGDTVFVVGFAIVAVLLLLCGAQCVAMSIGKTLLPALHLGSSKGGVTAGEAGSARLAAPGAPDPALGGYGPPGPYRPAPGPSGSGSPGPSGGGAGQPRPRKRTARRAGDPR